MPSLRDLLILGLLCIDSVVSQSDPEPTDVPISETLYLWDLVTKHNLEDHPLWKKKYTMKEQRADEAAALEHTRNPPPTEEETRQWAAPLQEEILNKLRAHRQEKFPEGLPTEVPEEDPELGFGPRELVVSKKKWKEFVASLGPTSDTNPVENLIKAVYRLQLFRDDADRLMIDTWRISGDHNWEAFLHHFWACIRKITNVTPPGFFRARALPEDVNTKGIFDGSIFRLVPDAALEQNREAFINLYLRKLFSYKSEDDGETIILNDTVFLMVWDIFLDVAESLDDFENTLAKYRVITSTTQFMANPDLTILNSYGNENPRPSGKWDRTELGYDEYYAQKYGYVYQPIGPQNQWWGVWESINRNMDPKERNKLMASMFRALEVSTAAVARGMIPWILELFADISLKVHELSMDSLEPVEDWAMLKVPIRRKYLIEGFPLPELKPDTSIIPMDMLEKHPEYFGTDYTTEKKGWDKWDDSDEVRKYIWRGPIPGQELAGSKDNVVSQLDDSDSDLAGDEDPNATDNQYKKKKKNKKKNKKKKKKNH